MQPTVTATLITKLVIDYLDHCSLSNTKLVTNDSDINKKQYNFLNAPQILCLPNELLNPEGNSRWVLSSVKFKVEYEESTAYFWLFADKLSTWKNP